MLKTITDDDYARIILRRPLQFSQNKTAGSLKDLWQVRMRVIQNCEKAPKETVSQKRNMTCMQCTSFYSISFPHANQRNVRRFSRPCSGDEMRRNL